MRAMASAGSIATALGKGRFSGLGGSVPTTASIDCFASSPFFCLESESNDGVGIGDVGAGVEGGTMADGEDGASAVGGREGSVIGVEAISAVFTGSKLGASFAPGVETGSAGV